MNSGIYDCTGDVSDEPAPILDSDRTVSRADVDGFRERGHVHISRLVDTAELAFYRPLLLAAVDRLDRGAHDMEQLVRGGQKGWQFVDNVWRHDQYARRFVTARRFARVAADLLGVDRVRLFRDQSYFKAPGGVSTSWHQDAYFLPLDTDRIVTMWLTLTDVTPDMAPLTFVSGSHRCGYLGTSLPDDAAMNHFEQSLIGRDFELANYQYLAAGDATFHAGWTLHSSRSNSSQVKREAFVVVYYADGARVAMPDIAPDALPQEHLAAAIRHNNLTSCLPGLAPGEQAATTHNPIVFQREPAPHPGRDRPATVSSLVQPEGSSR